MARPKIHYLHPKLGYHACGMGDLNLVKTSRILDEVTCDRCLGTVAADKLPRGRPKKPGKLLRKSKALYLSAEDWGWLESQENQAQTIRDAISLYRRREALAEANTP